MGHFRKQMITLLTSAECGLNCEYCYVPKMKNIKNEHKKINVDFACIAIKDYFEQTNNYYIRFFGAGEPTVAFNEMKAIHKYASKLAGMDVKTELQTNGYFNDKVAHWIDEHCDIVWISFDGLPELNDKQRPTISGKSSSDVIIGNIKRFVKNINMQFGVRVTITNGNFEKQIEILEYLHSLGVKYVCGSPSYSSTANESILHPRILEFSEYFVDAYYYALKLGMFYQTHLIVNFDEIVTAYCRACAPSPHVTTDGYISCCDWALFGAEYLPGPLQKLFYGKYNYEQRIINYDEKRLKEIQNRCVETLEKGSCSGCSTLKHCAGGCICKTIVISDDLYTPSEEWCLATKFLFEKLPINQGLYPCFHS
jgi:radical SAM protein with 4Fe4S-binding SPASM domain